MIIALEVQGFKKSGQELYLFLSSNITMMIGALLKEGIPLGAEVTLDPNFYFSNQDVEHVQLYTTKGLGGSQGLYKYSFEARIQMKTGATLSMTKHPVKLMHFNYGGEFYRLSKLGMQPFSCVTILDLTNNLKTHSVYGYNRTLGKEIVTRSGIYSHATHGVGIYGYDPKIVDSRAEGKTFLGREPLEPYISFLGMKGFTKGVYVCEECGHKRTFTTKNLGILRGRCEGCKLLQESADHVIQTFVPVALAEMFLEYKDMETKNVVEAYTSRCLEWAESMQLIA